MGKSVSFCHLLEKLLHLPHKSILSRKETLESLSSTYIAFCFFLIGIVRGGVQLGPLGTTATNRPIVPAPDDYDVGEIGGMLGRGNQRTRRKPAPVPALSTTNPTCCPEVNPIRRGGKPNTNLFSYGTASCFLTTEYLHPYPHTSSWRSTYLVKHMDNIFFVFSFSLIFLFLFLTSHASYSSLLCLISSPTFVKVCPTVSGTC
jgi:hypothetical protein